MDHIIDSTTRNLYRSIRILYQWTDLTLINIGSELRSRDTLAGVPESTTNQKIDVLRGSWRTIVSYYFNEIFNFPECKATTYREMAERAAHHTGLNIDIVVGIMDRTWKTVCGTGKNLGVPGYKTTHLQSHITVEIGLMTFKLPKLCYARLSESVNSNIESLARLFLRYYPLGPTGGFFWSMDPRLYAELSQCSLPVLEGFASPFNHNLTDYCSLFDEDKKYGSKGNFYTYMDGLRDPHRIIVNPPYTQTVLAKAADTVINYLNRVQGAECIMMYPTWKHLKCLDTLKSWPTGTTRIVDKGDYTLYNWATGQTISTPMSLMFCVLGSPDHIPSITADRLYELSRKVHEETYKEEPSRGWGEVSKEKE